MRNKYCSRKALIGVSALMLMIGMLFGVAFQRVFGETEGCGEALSHKTCLVTSMSCVEALESASRAFSTRRQLDGDITYQRHMNRYSWVSAIFLKMAFEELKMEIEGAKEFDSFREEYEADSEKWEEIFKLWMGKQSPFRGGTIEEMEIAERMSYLIDSRIDVLRKKWLPRITVRKLGEVDPRAWEGEWPDIDSIKKDPEAETIISWAVFVESEDDCDIEYGRPALKWDELIIYYTHATLGGEFLD